MNDILRGWHQWFLGDMLRAIAIAIVRVRRRIQRRCAIIPAHFWFQTRWQRNFPDRRFGDARRRRADAAKRRIGNWRSGFARRLRIFPRHGRCRRGLRFRIWQGNNRRHRGWLLDWFRFVLRVLRISRRRNRAREVIGKTVRFARNEGHGLQWELNLLAILVFRVNSNIAAEMSLPMVEATLANAARSLSTRHHPSRHGLLLRGNRSARSAGAAR